MSEKFTLQEFIDSCNFEGGLIQGFMDGLHASELDDEYPHIKDALTVCYSDFIKLEEAMDTANEMIYEKTGKRWSLNG